MLTITLFAFPAACALIAAPIRSLRTQLAVLLCAAVMHALLTGVSWFGPRSAGSALLGLDALGLIVLSLTSVLFLCVSFYSVAYVTGARQGQPAAQRMYVPLLLLFLATMSLVSVSRDLALMWVAVEATTLASAPLIFYHGRGPALEAAWKYLIICSVGIALALMGTFALAIAARDLPNAPGFGLPALLAAAPALDPRWLGAAFVLVVVGYGTKMGLVPLHTWLPDAHSQAPSPVSSLLSGALLNCAFLGILRFYQVCLAAGDAAFAERVLITLGLVSIGVAAAFMIGQRDYKRLLAYSSVENMGILAVGAGLGGQAVYGAMLHAVNHSLGKGALFMLAGNVLDRFGSTDTRVVRGVFRRLPITGVVMACALFAIAGSPPFGSFLSEFIIFMSAMSGPHLWVGVLFAALLALAFIGLCTVVMPMLQGSATAKAADLVCAATDPALMRTLPAEPFAQREPFLRWAPPLLLMAAVLVLGLYIPSFLADLLAQAAALLKGA